MGLMDKVSGMLKGKGKQVNDAIDKVAAVVDDKTGGKHSDKIESVAEKAKNAADKLDDK
jgi:ABC-type transporter Mla subunit MlaD